MSVLGSLFTLPGFLSLLVKSTLLLGLTLAALFGFRSRSPAFKHFLLTLALFCLLFLPALHGLLPAWDMGLLPSLPGLSGDLSGPVTDRTAEPEAALVRVVGGSPEWAAAAKTAGSPRGTSGTRSLSRLVGWIWLGGAALLLAGIFIGLAGAASLSRRGERMAGQPWERICNRFRRATRFSRRVRLIRSRQAVVPITWGLLRPVVILPAASEFWPWPQSLSVLFHELSHIRRMDFPVRLLARLVRALYWFQPLCWLAFRRLALYQEKACDEMVIRLGVRPSVYARHLLEIKRGLTAPPAAMAALAMAGHSQLEERLVEILDGRATKPKEINMKTRWILILITVVAVLGIGSASPFAQEKKADEKQAVTASSASGTDEEARKAETGKKAETRPGETQNVQVVTRDGKTYVVTISDDDQLPILSEKGGKFRVVTLKAEGDKAGGRKSLVVIRGADGKEKQIKLPKGTVFTVVSGDEKSSREIVIESDAQAKAEGKDGHVVVMSKRMELTTNDDGTISITTSDADGEAPPAAPAAPESPSAPSAAEVPAVPAAAAAPDAPPAPPAPPRKVTTQVKIVNAKPGKQVYVLTTGSDSDEHLIIDDAESVAQKRTLSSEEKLAPSDLETLRAAVERFRSTLAAGIGFQSKLDSVGFTLELERPAGGVGAEAWKQATKDFDALEQVAKSLAKKVSKTLVIRKVQGE